MATPAVTVGVCTFNRAHLWQRGLLLNSLRNQTDQDFELLVVDDNSTDGTLNELRWLLKEFPRARLFHCTAPKKQETQSDALPQNILIREASAPVFLHLDDDGWLSPLAVAFVKSLALDRVQGVYYGELYMVQPEDLKVIWKDTRTHVIAQNKPGIHRIPDGSQSECGAVWATATGLLRHLGGHDLSAAHRRGSDRRLGARLKQLTRTWYVAGPALRFYHLGKSWTQQHAGNAELIHKFYQPRDTQQEVIANGGMAFWDCGKLDRLYREVVLTSQSQVECQSSKLSTPSSPPPPVRLELTKQPAPCAV